jgi:hypothetical protein
LRIWCPDRHPVGTTSRHRSAAPRLAWFASTEWAELFPKRETLRTMQNVVKHRIQHLLASIRIRSLSSPSHRFAARFTAAPLLTRTLLHTQPAPTFRPQIIGLRQRVRYGRAVCRGSIGIVPTPVSRVALRAARRNNRTFVSLELPGTGRTGPNYPRLNEPCLVLPEKVTARLHEIRGRSRRSCRPGGLLQIARVRGEHLVIVGGGVYRGLVPEG